MEPRRRSRRQPPIPKEPASAAPAPAPLPPAPAGAGETGKPVAAGQWSLPYPAAVFFTCLAAAFLFLLLGPYSNFGPIGYLDPWYYTGYFMHFSYLVKAAGATYYVSRLPWIVPGLIVFRIAQPAAATVILNALILTVCAMSLYFIVLWRYGKWPAVLACVALATNPYFIYSVAWDYPDGPAVAYAFVALLFFLRPRQGRTPNSLIGGMFLAFSGYTNLAGLPVLLSMMTIPLWRNRRSLRALAVEIFRVFCGGVAATALLIPVFKALVGQYMFFKPQLDQIQYIRSHPGYLERMWGTGYAWLPSAYRLAPALLMLLLGALLLIARRKRSDAFVPCYLFLAANSILFAIFEFVFHNVGLRVPYGGTFMLTPVLGFAGLLIGECWRPAAPEGGAAPALRCAAVAAFGLALPFWFTAHHPAFVRPALMGPILIALAIAAGTAVAAPLRRSASLSALSCCLLFAGLFLGPACDNAIAYPFQNHAALFRSVVGIGRLVDAGLGPDRRIRFWYDTNEPAGPLFDSVSSLYLWGYQDYTAKLPVIPAREFKDIFEANTTFVHLTTDPDRIARRDQLLAARGVATANERRWSIPSELGTVYVAMEDVTGMPAAR